MRATAIMALCALLATSACKLVKEEQATNAAAPVTAQQAVSAPASAPSPAAPADTTAIAPPETGLIAEFIALKPSGAVPPSSGRAAPQAGDKPDTFDHPAVPRYQGVRIDRYRQKQFDQTKLLYATVNDARKLPPGTAVDVEGRVTDIVYFAPKDRSPFEIWRSYQKGLADAGFVTAFSCEREACGKTADAMSVLADTGTGDTANNFAMAAFRRADGVRINLSVWQYSAWEPRITLKVVEPVAMEQGVKTLSSTDIGRDVASTGKAVLYAVQFETDKATLRPESGPQLKAIADWLNAGATRALVVGHTDDQGAFPYNIALSQRRAEAVVAALAGQYAIKKDRLTPFGNGMAAPVASNRSPEGQARNRRVEVVEMAR